MRQPYEPPEIVALGSVTDLTQAQVLASGTDSLSFVPIFGEKPPVAS